MFLVNLVFSKKGAKFAKSVKNYIDNIRPPCSGARNERLPV